MSRQPATNPGFGPATTRDIKLDRNSRAPAGQYVQQGHTLTTVKETERTTSRNWRGSKVVKTKTRTVYYVDGKEVSVGWFDRLRMRFMSTYERQAFLAKKLLRQEKRARKKASKK